MAANKIGCEKGYRSWLIVPCILALPLTTALAQGPGSVLLDVAGIRTNDELGYSVAGIGDVNGDGIPDFVVGAVQVGGSVYPGRAVVYSGADGTEIWSVDGASANDRFGDAVEGAGDVNNDGIPDVIVGAFGDDPNGLISGGRAWVFSGVDGSVLHMLDGQMENEWFGRAVAGVGDINGDGHDDLAVGARGTNGDPYGMVRVYSGVDGALLWETTGASHEAVGFGRAVAAAGDLNADGIPDIIVGGSQTQVISGVDGSTLLVLASNTPGDFGVSVDSAGDVNGDGVLDFVVGAFGSNQAHVFSGADGSRMMILRGSGDPSTRGVAGAGDVNGDGFGDVLVGRLFGGPGAQGLAEIYSGVDGLLLFRFDGQQAESRFGFAVASIGDVDNDGKPDVVVGALREDVGGMTDAGKAYLIATDASVPPVSVNADTTANWETHFSGTVTGTYIDTQVDDGVREVITERESGGKRSNRHSYLENQWDFNLPTAETVAFFIKAHRTVNTEGDDFLVDWSSDTSNWSPLLTVSRTVDDGTYQTAALPSGLGGAFHIRIQDTDRTSGNNSRDSIFIDHMYVSSQGGGTPTTAPVAPSGLVATALGADTVNLTWVDNASDEEGFRIQRRIAGGTWTNLIILAGSGFLAFEDSGLAAGASYSYRIMSYNAAGDSAWSSAASTTTGQAGTVDVLADGEVLITGTLTGDYTSTHAADNTYEIVEEVQTVGGPPSGRITLAEHIWSFTLPTGGTSITFLIQAWREDVGAQFGASDGDNFLLEWSTDGISYTSLLTVDKSADDNQYQSALLPAGLSGTLFIRATDTDRTPGHRWRDNLQVDHMFISVQN